ncbi:molybdate ABC transporter substrate-binding protein [Phenylobacterium sp.]|jgi:molybdate transport system substrate-binding protein|uniref:molybdate ABC transporter substrate-binding protein n=1 Tax=Phenylobacterium sp. TaxID=1871053 RepID=UPI002F92E2FD
MTSRRAILKLALAAAVAPRAAAAQAVATVAAASDLSEALPLVAAAFQRRTGRAVRIVYGPTHVFTQQIQKDTGRYELFLAADESYVRQLEKVGLTANTGALYGIGRLCLYVPNGSKVRLDGRLRDLGAATRDGRLQKLALFSTNGPYGRASREALTRARIWMPVQPKVALAENANQMVQLATSPGVQAALLPLSVAIMPRLRAAGAYILVPDTYHRPLRHRAVLLKGAGATAEAFYRFLRDPEARAIMRQHGFNLPGGR